MDDHGSDGAFAVASATERLVRAAAELDSALITEIVQTSIDQRGVPSTWDRLVRPVWEYIGSRAEDTDGQALAEYFYIRCAFTVLAAARGPQPRFRTVG